jgi:peptidoglycan biosynthesis protein MviN/MurJ (putative lipid II flippase)
MFIYQHFVNIEFYFEETQKIAAASISAAVINIGLNYLLLPLYGYLISGYVVLISYLIFAVVHYFMCKKICIKNNCPTDLINVKVVLLILAVFALLAILLTFGYKMPLIKYVFILLVGAMMYYKMAYLYHVYKEMK